MMPKFERLDRHLLPTGHGLVLIEMYETYLLATDGQLLDDTHFMYVPRDVLYITPFAKCVQDYYPLREHEAALKVLIAVHRRIEMEA